MDILLPLWTISDYTDLKQSAKITCNRFILRDRVANTLSK